MNTSAKDIARVEAPVKKLLCERSEVHMSIPDSLKYGLRGGMGWETWGEKVNGMRIVDLMVAIMEGGAAAALMRSELQRLQLWVGTKASAMTLQAGHQCVEETACRSLWSVKLWQWMMNGSRELQLSGRGLGHTPSASGDRALQESPHIDGVRLIVISYARRAGAGECTWLLVTWWQCGRKNTLHKQDWRLVMMVANISGGVSLMKAVPKADSKARAGSTVVMTAADSLIIAKCISITNDTRRVSKQCTRYRRVTFATCMRK
jgi:hypothetical protein